MLGQLIVNLFSPARTRRLTASNVLIYTHLLLYMGLRILANIIRHAILGTLDGSTFGLTL